MDLDLDLAAPVDELLVALVDTPSVSGNERAIADAVERALAASAHLTVTRDGDAVVARTSLGRDTRVVLGGHLDTVPIADNVPSRREGDVLHGCGTTDMKSGVAVMLRLAAAVSDPRYDLTYVFYDHEEVEAELNGLGRLSRNHPDWLTADFALLLEPTDGEVEGGCQGTLRADVRLTGKRSHSARSWLGENAIHAAAPVLERLARYEARSVDIDGCVYREGLNAVQVSGGVAGNVIPDECVVSVNFRFAPDRSVEQAFAHVAELFSEYDVTLSDAAPGALPGLDRPPAAAFLAAVGRPPRAKYGWTDVARFSELGIPAVNFGPGDPNLAHTREEWVSLTQVAEVEAALHRYLTAG
ncbi:MAG: succinyl-diaminopimelate desuccinylase [Frankiaceae bacterium]|nr:succinyl-diaminopimelate desuccinylase [Frankiaceae bacterium]